MTPKKIAQRESLHPLVGTWVEEENPFDTTTVQYTIEAKGGRFRVAGVDEPGGVPLRISRLTWDGRRLRFVSLYPPTGHRAEHEFWVISKGRAKHRVTYSDEDGKRTVMELWKKRKPARGNRSPGA
jgi:hypothetical protein